jgi:hypothetical protein
MIRAQAVWGRGSDSTHRTPRLSTASHVRCTRDTNPRVMLCVHTGPALRPTGSHRRPSAQNSRLWTRPPRLHRRTAGSVDGFRAVARAGPAEVYDPPLARRRNVPVEKQLQINGAWAEQDGGHDERAVTTA